MGPSDSIVEVFGVQTNSQLTVGLFHYDKRIHPVCRLVHFLNDAVLLHLVQLFLEAFTDCEWDSAWRVDFWYGIFLKVKVNLSIDVAKRVKEVAVLL